MSPPNQADSLQPYTPRSQMMSSGDPWSKYLPGAAMGLQAVGALLAGNTQAAALRTNAKAYGMEADIATRQGFEQEAQQRITSSKELGRQVAAAGQSGGGYGGSTGAIVGQSARNAELDALNIRYKAALQRWSFGAQAGNLRQEAGVAQTGGYLKAGAALLRGYGGNYTGTTPYYFPSG